MNRPVIYILPFLIVCLLTQIIACKDMSTEEILNGDFISTVPVPEIIYPVNEEKITGLSTTASWTAVKDATLYEIDIAQNNDFTTMVAGSPFTIETNSLKLTSEHLPEESTYYIRVRTIRPQVSEYSETITIHALNDTLYVYCPADTETCDDTGMTGNKNLPFQTISHALTEARKYGFQVKVAKRGNSTAYAEEVAIVAGVNLYGGYNHETWQKDSETDKTKITSGSPYTFIALGISEETNTILDGFDIENTNNSFSNTVKIISSSAFEIKNCSIHTGLADHSSAVYIISSSPVISKNIIVGGNTVEDRTIYCELSFGVQIKHNTITSGTASSKNFSISVEHSEVTIHNNLITHPASAGFHYGIHTSFSDVTITSNSVTDPGGTNDSHGIYATESDIFVSSNKIYGGDGLSSKGIYLHKTTALIQDNTINGGSNNSCTGIHNDTESNSVINHNSIYAGTSTGLYGSNAIENTNDSAATIRNNLIHGGSGGYGSIGISNNSTTSPILIQNNTISAGTAEVVNYAVLNMTTSAVSIVNNILFTSGDSNRFGIYEQNSDSDPLTVQNNNFFDAGSGGGYIAYFDSDGNCEGGANCTVAQLQNLSDITVSGNIDTNPHLSDIDGADNNINTMADNNWNLNSDGTSPCSVAQGGLNLSDDFIFDYNLYPRTDSWSIGAYEWDGDCN